MTKDITDHVKTEMKTLAQIISSRTGLDTGRTIIGKLADLHEARMARTLDIYMLLCLETLEVRR